MTTIDLGTEVKARMRERMREAASLRLAARGAEGRAGGRSLADYGWRLRQAVGFGLVRTGLWLVAPGRVGS